MSDATKAILLNKEVIAIDQDPLGAPAQMAKTDGEVEVWERPLKGNATALAFFNKGDEPAEVKLGWSEARLKKPKNARDLWAHAAVKVSRDGYSAKIPAHGTVLLKLE
jgi:alpha-galactosidase